MANTFPSPITLPDPNAFGTGQKLLAGPLEYLFTTMNHCYAEGHATNVVQQQWADSLCSWNGVKINACTWRIPVISDDHVTVDCWVYASATVNPGTIHFSSLLAAATVNAAVAVGAAAWVNLPALTVSVGGSYEDIIMDLEAGAGGTITVERVLVRYPALTSPLGTTVPTTGFVPFGSGYWTADEALPSYAGVSLSTGLSDLLARQRVLASWSGLSNIQAYSTAARLTLPGGVHPGTGNQFNGGNRISANPVSRGALDRAVSYTLWAYIVADPLINTRLQVGQFVEGNWAWFGGYTVVPAAAAGAWYSLSFTLQELQAINGVPHAMTRLRPILIAEDASGEYPNLIYTYSVFGV